MRGKPINYSANAPTRTPRTPATVSFYCWVGIVTCIAAHVLLTETTRRYPPRFPTLGALEPTIRGPLLLGEALLWIVGVATGFDGTIRRGRRRWLAVLSLILCLLTPPALFLLFVLRYAPT